MTVVARISAVGDLIALFKSALPLSGGRSTSESLACVCVVVKKEEGEGEGDLDRGKKRRKGW